MRGARQLITLRGPKEARRGPLLRELEIIQDGALLIRDGVIEDVGPSRRVEKLSGAREAREIDATGHVVIPAFVDSMASLAFAHSGVEVREQAGPDPESIQHHGMVEGARALKSVSCGRMEARCRVLLNNMLRHGTGTVEAQTGYGLDAAGEYKTLRAYRAIKNAATDLVPTYFVGGAPSPEYDNDRSAYLKNVAEPLLVGIARRKLAHFVDVRCGVGGFEVSAARKFLHAAGRLGFCLKLQGQQFAPDDSATLAAEYGVFSIGHLDFLPDAGIDLLARSPVIATLCPGASYHSATGRFAPARKLIDAGAAVSLASNFNAESSPDFNMAFILSLACRHMQMIPAEALAAGTINAAHALGVADRTGSIEPGKQADLTIFHARDYREILETGGTNMVRTVMKKGVVAWQAK